MGMNIKTDYYGGYYIAELEEPAPVYGHWGQDWYPEVDQWCEGTFGPSDLWGENPVNGWKRMRNKYFFIDESTLGWFVTRWS
jgi:hypothetical protein